MFGLIYLKKGTHIFKRARRIKKRGLKKYSGNAEKICEHIIEDCWDNKHKYFRVSTGNFPEFWSRDFSWVCESLIKLGFKKQVKQTLEYALEIFEKNNKITTTISLKQKPFDFPYYAPDSLASILKCLTLLKDKKPVNNHKNFLEKEIDRFYKTAIDKKTGLIRKDRYFSSMKDFSKRKSSCYDNCMAFIIQNSSEKLKLKNPLKKYDYEKLIMKNFWKNNHFLDDLSGKDYIAGDANLFPFWSGLIKDKKIMKKAFESIKKEKLDKPLPLRYTTKDKDVRFIFWDMLIKDYEKDVVWTHMGLPYVELTGIIDKKLQEEYIKKYRELIEKYHNFPEVLKPNMDPYENFFYFCDGSMIWCANYLWLSKNKEKIKDKK
jgi:hypothetical protein